MNISDHNLAGSSIIVEDTFGTPSGARSDFVREQGPQFLLTAGNIASLGTLFTTSITDVIYFNNKWIAIGSATAGTGQVWPAAGAYRTVGVAYSTDFINWTLCTLAGSGTVIPYSLFINPNTGKLNIFLGTTEVQESSDGITFTAVSRSGTIACMRGPISYKGNVLSKNSTAVATNIGIYNTTTNLETTYTIPGVGAIFVDAIATNNDSVIALATSANPALNVISASTDLASWSTPVFRIDGAVISSALVKPINIVYTGSYYIAMAIPELLCGFNVTAVNQTFDTLSFFKSVDGVTFDYCGLCSIKFNSLANQFDRLTTLEKYSISFTYSDSSMTNQTAAVTPVNGYIYFPVSIKGTGFNTTSSLTKYMAGLIQSKDGGVTWDIIYTGAVHATQITNCRTIVTNSQKEVVASFLGSTANAPTNFIKSSPSAKQLRRVY